MAKAVMCGFYDQMYDMKNPYNNRFEFIINQIFWETVWNITLSETIDVYYTALSVELS